MHKSVGSHQKRLSLYTTRVFRASCRFLHVSRLNALITLLIPAQAKAEIKPYGCLDKVDILLERKDSYTVICYRYAYINTGKETLVRTDYSLIKWNNQNDADYMVFALPLKDNLITIWISEKQEVATFLLKGRRFDSWGGGNPNVPLVNRHKDDITLLLNDMEKAAKLQQAPLIRNF